METKNWTHIDRSEWLPGPWDDEPFDKMQYLHEVTGLPCLMKRNILGAWCGYVGVPEGHPWYEKSYAELDESVDVHGGLTYDGHCQEGDEARTICHIVAPGEPDNVWWLGFDCAHWNDLMPTKKFQAGWPLIAHEVYRDVAYVQAEIDRLAQQVAAAATVAPIPAAPPASA